jgi:broad specificity phosphatase PhoE
MWKEKINNAKWKNLYLIRHGESTCNEVNRFGGAIGAPPTALGEAQAKKTHGQWRRRLIHVACVSPLLHAWIYENALHDDSADMPEGEHFKTFNKRILAFFLDELHELITQDQTVLVVAYQYVIELLSPLILGIPIGGYDLRLPDADILNVSELGHYVHQKSRKMNLAQGWTSNVLMLGVGLALSQLSIVTDDFLPLIKLGYSLSTGLSIARVDMSSTRWSSNNGMFSLKRIFSLFSLAPLTVQELAPLFPQRYSLSFFFLLPALPTACKGIIVCRSFALLAIRHSYDDPDRPP